MLAESKLQSPHMKLLSKLEKIIYNLSKDNLDKSIQKTMKSFDFDFPFSYNLIISALVYHAFYSKNDSDDIYIDYLEGIQTKEEENDQIGQKIIDIFYNYMCKNNIKESYHLIEKMIERNLLDDDKKSKYQNSDFLLHEIKKIYHKSYKELTDDELELHKKSLKEGVNTSEIATIIRNDEIQKLQNEAIASSFDYDQKIEQSFYEKHSFINHDKVSLIDYAAFFGSIECFKYLMLNEANMNNAGKYAIAGGNLEIIYLCEKEHLTFKGAYEAAIKFHKNDIFKYVFENKLETLYEHDKDIRELGCFCIKYGNYEIFSYLEDKIKINDKVINATAKIGNLYMIKYFIQDYQVPKDILVNSIESNNIELVKYVLAQDGSDINAKYENKTPLILAIEIGSLELTKMLLNIKEIEINLKGGQDGNTPLIHAAQFGNTEIVKLLLEQEGIDINAKNLYGETALTVVSRNGCTEIVKLLLEQKGIDTNAKNILGYTALIWASINGNTETVKLLLDQESDENKDLNARNRSKALKKATEKEHNEIIELLREKGVNEIINESSKSGGFDEVE